MTARPTLIVVAIALTLAGCGGGGGGGDAGDTTEAEAGPAVPAGQLSVAEAKEQGGAALTVFGSIFVRADEWNFCHRLDEISYPPECFGATLRIANPTALESVKLTEGIGQASGLLWTESPVSLTGDVSGDAITVSEVAGE
jgi:hypothetical protein